MRSRFDASRFDASLVGLQWALRFVLLVMVLLALAACSDDPTGNGSEIVAVQVSAAADQVLAGDSLLLSAMPRQADGDADTDLAIAWFSTDTAVARVEGRAGQKAVVVGKAPGPVVIRAIADDKFGQATLTVVVTKQGVSVVTAISPESAPNELDLMKLRGSTPAANLAQVGTAEVAVRTGPPGGGTLAGKPFSILPRVATVPEHVLWVSQQVEREVIPVDDLRAGA